MSRGGDLIREARRRAGLTQSEVATAAGTSQSAVARWEAGAVKPSMDTTMRVLRSIGFDLDYMLVEYDDSDYAQARSLLRLDDRGRWQQFEHLVEVAEALRGSRRVS